MRRCVFGGTGCNGCVLHHCVSCTGAGAPTADMPPDKGLVGVSICYHRFWLRSNRLKFIELKSATKFICQILQFPRFPLRCTFVQWQCMLRYLLLVVGYISLFPHVVGENVCD